MWQNALGLLSCQGRFASNVIDGTITSHAIFACIDAFVKQLRRRRYPVVIVLDNAPVYGSPLFEEYHARRQELDISIEYTPSYSTELNMIEIL